MQNSSSLYSVTSRFFLHWKDYEHWGYLVIFIFSLRETYHYLTLETLSAFRGSLPDVIALETLPPSKSFWHIKIIPSFSKSLEIIEFGFSWGWIFIFYYFTNLFLIRWDQKGIDLGTTEKKRPQRHLSTFSVLLTTFYGQSPQKTSLELKPTTPTYW